MSGQIMFSCIDCVTFCAGEGSPSFMSLVFVQVGWMVKAGGAFILQMGVTQRLID